MRCGKKVCHRLNSSQKKSKTKRRQKKRHCANELNYTNFWIVYSSHWNAKYHIFFSASSYILPVKCFFFFGFLLFVLRFGRHVHGSRDHSIIFYFLWLTSKTFFSQKFIKHWKKYFSTAFFCLWMQMTHMIKVFLTSITRIYIDYIKMISSGPFMSRKAFDGIETNLNEKKH